MTLHSNRTKDQQSALENSQVKKSGEEGMAGAKIIIPEADQKPCVCGATISLSWSVTAKREVQIWLCSRHCGARGRSYVGALRRKVRLDFLSWGELRRNAQALIGADADDHPMTSLQ